MSDSYKVSVVIPVYNARKYLKETFRSVKNQTIGFENIQLIMVDDCSADGSYSLMSRWAKRYSNVTVLKTPRGSGSASEPRNMGLDVAEADYIMFLDADDALRKNAAELLYGIMISKDVDLADAAYEQLGAKFGADKRYEYSREGLYNFAEDADEWFPISHPIFTKMFKRSIIEKVGLRFDPLLRNGEDSVFLYGYMAAAKSAWHVNRVIYEYRVHADSVSHNVNEKYHLGLIDSCSKMQELFMASSVERLAARFIEEIAVTSIDLLCDAGNMDDETIIMLLKQWYMQFRVFAGSPHGVGVALGDILGRDAARDDYETFERDFFAMRRLYEERSSFVQQIFSSRGWKLITFINKLLGRG